jgi:hypothetical protein
LSGIAVSPLDHGTRHPQVDVANRPVDYETRRVRRGILRLAGFFISSATNL